MQCVAEASQARSYLEGAGIAYEAHCGRGQRFRRRHLSLEIFISHRCPCLDMAANMTESVLNFKLIGATAATSRFIDIARSMSIVNRRLVRQHGLWHIHGIKVIGRDATDPYAGFPYEVNVSGAPRTWVVKTALQKTFKLWKAQQRRVFKALGSAAIKPKWHDFKVYLNEAHRSGTELTPTSGSPLMLSGGGGDAYITGEWTHSRIVMAGDVNSVTEPMLHIVGGDNGSTNVGMINQYEMIRMIPEQGPDMQSDIEQSIFARGSEAHSEAVEELIENLEIENDTPPYDIDDLPGGEVNGCDAMTYAYGSNTSTHSSVIPLHGFTCPNGVFEIRVDPGAPAPTEVDYWIQVFVSHKEAY